MFYNTLYVLTILCFVASYTNGQREKKFFRKDYTYIDATESFYKIHTIERSWSDAKQMCAREGASLFYPENEEEAAAVISFWNATQPYNWLFIGISDLVAKGVFETIDGLPVYDVYNNWGPGEPNNAGGIEDCVVLTKTGTLNDDQCTKKYPFICKRNLLTLEWNVPCNIPYLDYTYNEELGRCYKFHVKPSNWTDAHAVCSAEQSYLAVINSPLEAENLVTLTNSAPTDKFKGLVMHGVVLLGFHNRNDEGWQTVRGTTLDESGYDTWGNGQPDGGDSEKCGSMFYNGRLNDIGCAKKCFFICEHDISGTQVDERFSDDK